MPSTRTTSFPTNVVISDALGTPASPTGGYFGFANAGGTQVASTGPRLWAGLGNPNGILTAPIGTQWTNSNTGIVYINTDGATAWTVLGGGTTTARNWFPLIEQSPLNAKTDYYNVGNVLDPKWSTWNPGANTTASQAGSTTRLQLLQTTHAGSAVGGIYQAAPAATRYAITTWIGLAGRSNNVANGGVFAAGNISGAPTTAAFVSVDQIVNSAVAAGSPTAEFLNWTDYTALAGSAASITGLGQGALLRLYVDTVAANFLLLTSNNGLAWVRYATVAFAATVLNAAPSFIGQHVNNANTGADVSLYSGMFRVDATTDPFLPIGGFA